MGGNKQDSLSKDELIQKLQKISRLCDNILEIKDQIDSVDPEDHYPRKVSVPVFPGEYGDEDERDEVKDLVDHTDENAIDQMGHIYDDIHHPKKPDDPIKPSYKGANTGKSQEKQFKLRLVSNIGLGVAIFFLLGALVGTSDTPEVLPVILMIAALGAVAFVGGRYLGKKEKEVEDKLEAEARAAYDSRIAELDRQYEQTVKAYEAECAAYAPIRKAFLKEYAKWREIYLESIAEEEKISEQLEADRQAVVDKICEEKLAPAMAELEATNDILSKDYLGAVDLLIDLLKSNRADNLKEAINVYEEIVYRERQLQLQREQEEQRRHEEELRRQDEERRYREEMQFREEQERQRRYEEDQRRRDEADRARAEARAREAEARHREYEEKERLRREKLVQDRERREQENAQRRAANMQCQRCAHVAHCSMKMSNAAPTCTGFTPR